MPKKKPLVTQHLEGISRDAIAKFPGVLREYIRGRQGIYALYKGEKLYYVGLAKDLRRRLKQHLGDRHADSWDRFSVYLTITDSFTKELESLLLRIIKLTGNRNRGRFLKSEKLEREFVKDVKTLQVEERARLVNPKKKRAPSQRCKDIPKSKATGRRPVLAPYADKLKTIRYRYQNKWVRATVRRDGSIGFKGDVYNSPSKAAEAVCGSKKNGWKAWRYERSPGDWVPLDTLRR